MPRIHSMTVQNIRTHERYSISFSPSTTVITGKNGAGKTSLLEALHIALQGKTFKTSDTDVLRKNADFFKISVTFNDTTERLVVFQPNGQYKKQFTINGKTVSRLTYSQKTPLVLFEPDDLRLITGSPSRRRSTIDTMISRVYPQYASYVRRYEKALAQRNMLLKQQCAADELFPWNVILSKYGYHITARRQDYIKLIDYELKNVYQQVSRTSDTVNVIYQLQNTELNSEQSLLTNLEQLYARDTLYGYTSIGPHRDTVQFMFNNSPAETITSRGETRSIVVALKQIELLLIERITGQTPILLLDDVLSELDTTRQKRLILQGDYQTVMTSTKSPRMKNALTVHL